ncbi:MAG: hypothetical protein JW941_05595 [Candidatus Coatesbacteria bacterium]|nr:hypothetical protein [Candidatus Coatesbacteria bacterium]
MRAAAISALIVAALSLCGSSLATQFDTFTNTNINTEAILFDGPFIWVGTDGGLVRWCLADGSSEKFTTSRGLVHNQVSSLAKDLSSGIWAGAFAGASRFYKEMWMNLDETTGLVSPRVEAVYTDDSGNVWFGTTGGATVYDWDEFTSYTTDDGLSDGWIKDIVEYSGKMYFATSQGLAVFDGVAWDTITTSDGLPGNNINCLTASLDGLFVGTHGVGVCFFDGNSWRSFSGSDGIDGSVIKDLFTDPSGNVWAVTELGVSLYFDSNWLSFDHLDGLPDDQLLSIAADGSGKVAVGTAHQGLWCWCEGSAILLGSPAGVLDNQVRSVTSTADGKQWFGCDGGLSCLQPGGIWTSHAKVDGQDIGTVNDIVEGIDGGVWIATAESGLLHLADGDVWTVYGVTDGLCDNRVHSLAIHEGVIYAGTGMGLSILTGTQFQSITAGDGLPFDSVESVAIDPNGRILMGNRSTAGGLAILDDGEISHYTTDDGLPSNSIYSINAERDGMVWLGTNMGAVEWDSDGMTIFNKSDGLAGFLVTEISYGPKDDVWFGTTNGISCFDGVSFESLTQSNGLADNRVEGICTDLNGDIWVATLGGVTRIRLQPSDRPTIAVSVSSPNYSLGDSVKCSLSLSNPGDTRSLDFYLGLIDDSNTIYCFGPNGGWLEGNICPWAQGFIAPAGVRMTLDPFLTIDLPSYFPPIFESGYYTFAAAICDEGSTEFIGDVSLATFELMALMVP